MNPKQKQLALIALLAVGVFGALILLGIYQCPVYGILGIPCPGCGMSRAAMAMLRGDIALAFAMNPGLFWLILCGGVVALSGVLDIFGCKANTLYKNKWLYVAIFAGLILIYVVRMAQLFPHTPPMNYNKNSLFYEIFCFLFG